MGSASPRLSIAWEEKRQHPRVELFATVELRDGDDVLVLSVGNLSLGGAWLAGDGLDLSRVAVGAEKELTIFDECDPGIGVTVRGRVLRRSAAGIALAWIGADDMFKVAGLIDCGTKS
jgi:PilZ domain